MASDKKVGHDVTGIKYKDKPSIIDELITLLRKLLKYCLCCVTCGCYPGPRDELNEEVYQEELMDEERTAVQNLLKYLDSSEAKEPTINDERLRALCILTYSDNVQLQRSAALCFAELSERMTTNISGIVLEPLVVLLKSKDTHIQKASSLAISNFALNGPDVNKSTILSSGAIKPLIMLLQSSNTEVQCNTCGCITTLATNDKNKQEIVNSGGVKPLLALAKSKDIRVKRNSTGALLNLTHLQSNRLELVKRGAIPVLVEVLHCSDPDVQYYCTAALSNLAVSEKHRTMMVAVGHYDVIRQLLKLLTASKEKVRCQACLALRNLASDGDNQILLTKLECLPKLHSVIRHSKGETLSAAMACLRNLSIHKNNEAGIIKETFLFELRRVVKDDTNPTAQIHAAGTIRNLAAGDQIQKISESGCVECVIDAMLLTDIRLPVLREVTAALAVLADQDLTKETIVLYKDGCAFQRLVHLASKSYDSEVCYNCAGTLGQVALIEIPDTVLEANCDGLLFYQDKFICSMESNLVHIALWTIVQLIRVPYYLKRYKESYIPTLVEDLLKTGSTDTIRELAKTITTKCES